MLERPHNIEEILQHRLQPYFGKRLSEITTQTTAGHKGWAGELLEDLLLVSNKNGRGPDFPEWGIEVKTLPLNEQFEVTENTFLSKISLPFYEGTFLKSSLYQKIKCIFWIPLIGLKGESLSNRRIGRSFLWEMNEEERLIFEQDWDELSDIIRSGRFTEISAHLGTALHIRPKAASSSDKKILEVLGQKINLLPIGFYLRRSFTQSLLNQKFGL